MQPASSGTALRRRAKLGAGDIMANDDAGPSTDAEAQEARTTSAVIEDEESTAVDEWIRANQPTTGRYGRLSRKK